MKKVFNIQNILIFKIFYLILEPIRLVVKAENNKENGLGFNLYNSINEKQKISDFSFKSNNDEKKTNEKNLNETFNNKTLITQNFTINSNSTQILETLNHNATKKIINDKEKSMIDHLSVMQKFRIQ